MILRKYKFILPLAFLAALLVLAGCTGAFDNRNGDVKRDYGVFVGANPEDIEILFDYRLAVIDAAYYSEAEIEILHKNGSKVYSYLNIGSVETFRDFYTAYRHLTLGEYENWPDEYWVDVSRPEWQKHINEEAGLLAEKGVDGFFLDNTDVYYLYPSADIFRGLVEIVAEIGQYKKDILINGGDVFVAETILDAPAPLIQITGVNQECVFTGIDFDNNTTTSQSPEASEYYQAYLERCKEAGLSVYLTEYGEDTEGGPWAILDEYCGKHQFTYFISKSLFLQ